MFTRKPSSICFLALTTSSSCPIWLVSGSRIGLGPQGGRGGAGAEAADRGTEARGGAGVVGCGEEVRVGGEETLLALSLASPEVVK